MFHALLRIFMSFAIRDSCLQSGPFLFIHVFLGQSPWLEPAGQCGKAVRKAGAPDFLLILEEQLSGPIVFLKFKNLGMRIILHKNK